MLHHKRDLADVIKVIDLELGEIVPDYPDGPNVITWALNSGRGRQKC